jgi:hypothetical protein
LNHYRKVLVSEVLPTVMAAEKEGDLKFLHFLSYCLSRFQTQWFL